MSASRPEPRASVTASEPTQPDTGSPVTLSRLSTDADIPLVISPARQGVDLASWAQDDRARIADLLVEHGALLFRGFDVTTPEYFQAVVQATSNGPLLEYKDRSSPRYEVGKGVYVSTIYPAEERIHPHNEGTYWKTWPLKIAFCCLRTAAQGGETPIADVRRVYDRIDPAIRERFREKQVMYVRNYNPGIGLTWQDAFQTKDPAVVEQYAADNAIQTEWIGGRLRTRQIRPAIRLHPVTGRPVWFNHGAFFHLTSLEPDVQEALLSSYGEEGLPYQTYFGDGTPIDVETVGAIREAYTAEKRMFAWKNGDVLLLDNMTVAHAREPYVGDRHVIVAMTEPMTAPLAAVAS